MRSVGYPSLFARIVTAGITLLDGLGHLLTRCGRVPVTADVSLDSHPLCHVRVVQLEGRSLGADPGQFGEVVPGRRARRRPYQRVAVTPRVVHCHDLTVAVAAEHIPQ